MKIDEAIKILQGKGIDCVCEELSQWTTALKLGIEALKREMANRRNLHPRQVKPLPGETEK